MRTIFDSILKTYEINPIKNSSTKRTTTSIETTQPEQTNSCKPITVYENPDKKTKSIFNVSLPNLRDIPWPWKSGSKTISSILPTPTHIKQQSTTRGINAGSVSARPVEINLEQSLKIINDEEKLKLSLAEIAALTEKLNASRQDKPSAIESDLKNEPLISGADKIQHAQIEKKLGFGKTSKLPLWQRAKLLDEIQTNTGELLYLYRMNERT